MSLLRNANFSLFLLCLFLGISVSHAQGQIKGDGNIISDEREIGTFSKLEIKGGYNVIFSIGEKEQLRIEGDSNLVALVRTEVKNGKLEIDCNCPRNQSLNPSHSLKIYLTAKRLTDLGLNGAVIFRSNSKLSGNSLNLNLSGASVLTADVALKTLTADISGGSNLNLSGTATNATITAAGSCNINSPGLKTEALKANLSGASQARASVSKTLDATLSGASMLHYKGSPAITKNLSGSSALRTF